MTTKNFFTYQTLLNFGFGLGLFFFPQMMVDTYGGQKTDIGGTFEIVARGYGTALIGLGIAGFLMRNAGASLARYAFLVATCVSAVLVTIVHIRALLRGDGNSLFPKPHTTIIAVIVLISYRVADAFIFGIMRL